MIRPETIEAIKRCCNINSLTDQERMFLENMLINLVENALDKQLSKIKAKIGTIPTHILFEDVDYSDTSDDETPIPHQISTIKIEDIFKVLNEMI